MRNLLVLFVGLSLNMTPCYSGTSHHKDKITHEHKHVMGKMDKTDKMDKQLVAVCPITGDKADAQYSYTHKGKTYYFCCSSCLDEFKKSPETYTAKMKTINLEAFQFGFSPSEITVEEGDIVTLNITSRDVTHGVFIKKYGINVAVKKDENKKVQFIAKKTGKFDILCSVYCGHGHHNMKAKLIVLKIPNS